MKKVIFRIFAYIIDASILGILMTILVTYIPLFNNKKIEDFTDKLIDLSEEESIRNYILKYDLDKYYVDLYNEYMFSDEISSKFNLDSDYLLKYREAINTKLSACSDVFKFLNENSDDNYSFEDGKIKFKTNELLDQYNQYIELIKS